MKNRSLRFRMISGGVLAVLLPLLILGAFSLYNTVGAIKEMSHAQTTEVAKGLAYMANLAVSEEMKMAGQFAHNATIVQAAMEYAGGGKAGTQVARATQELTALQQKIGGDYEVIYLIGLDGKGIADSLGGKLLNKGINLRERDYFKAAKEGKINVGSVVKSVATGNIVMTFAAPVYSPSNQLVGVLGSTIKVSFLGDKISAVKLGKTGYGYMIDRTGLAISHPKEGVALKVNALKEEGMKEFAPKMVAGEIGAQEYLFRGVKKIAGFAPVAATGWSICVTQDYKEAMAPATRLMGIIIVVGLILLAVAVVAFYFFARAIAEPIKQMTGSLNDASAQVAAASSQVASASQSLAQGSSEQASALEETSSSLEEMSSMTRQNADNAAQAKGLMGEAERNFIKLGGLMQTMVTSIQEVTTSSEETGKIIKTIDEIAFQTNLLALNAAVEAARAGEAGAGFAVVAGEVRNLAMRAADAAKNTSGLIENTIVTVKNSRDLTEQTQNAFKENMEISTKVGQLVDEIAAASSEQAQGIGQIGKAVAEMDKVVQGTAASAEESASAAEEMNAQAVQMKGYVEKLTRIINGEDTSREVAAAPASTGKTEKAGVMKHVKAKAGRKLLPPTQKAAQAKAVRPEEVIPFEKDGFKDF